MAIAPALGAGGCGFKSRLPDIFLIEIFNLNKKLDNSNESLGNIIIISAPSGAGKTTICKAVVDSSNNVKHSVSYTTRLSRKDEKNGREYFFIDKTEFE